MDLDMASAACQACKLLLVEANSNSIADMALAARRAVLAGATVVSNSYGSKELAATDSAYDSYYHNPGVPFTVSGGDFGYNNHLASPAGSTPSWPATHPDVISVGGTTLTTAANARGWTETLWSQTGSGCSTYEAKSGWQTDPNCSHRLSNDIAAVADPNTPVSIYNSPWYGGWGSGAGTSAAAPIVAGIIAKANVYTRNLAASALYKPGTSLFDVTAGTNGTCEGSYLCTAQVGYDGPSGLGTPHGIPAVWSKETTADPAAAGMKSLRGISCTAASACIAVGSSNDASGPAMAERWNGTSWTLQALASPIPDRLEGVSCTASTACTAVGTNAVAQRWNGSIWAAQTVPLPAGAQIPVMNDVSCFSATTCTAAGQYYLAGGASFALIERWNGTSWALQTAAVPSGATYIDLRGVSCASATTCTAVGWYYTTAGNEKTLVEVWNGTSWTIQSSPNTAGTSRNYLYSVSCVSGSDCTAVGIGCTASVPCPLIEHWNGTTWSIQASPNPPPYGVAQMNGVSCSAANTCAAVGSYYDGTAGGIGTSPLVLAIDGTGSDWHTQSAPTPTGGLYAKFDAISCLSTATCKATGIYQATPGTTDFRTLSEARP